MLKYNGSEIGGMACELVDNATTGSFTKRGEGDFTFMAANTCGGKTILEGGTLVLGVPNALPATTTIVPRGGVIEATADNFPAALAVDVSELDPEANAVRRCPKITFTLHAKSN